MIVFRFLIGLILFCVPSIELCAEFSDSSIDKNFTTSAPHQQIKFLTDECWRLREIDSDSALVLGQRALQLAEKVNFSEEIPRINNYIGVVYLHYLYQNKKSIPYFRKALNSSLRLRDSIQLAYAYNNLGDVYLFSGNNALAFQYSQASLQIFEKLGFKPGISYSYVNMGMDYRARKEFDKSLASFEKAIEIWKILKSDIGLGAVFYEKAKTFEEANQIDSALLYYQSSVVVSHESRNLRYVAKCYNGLANIYLQQDNYSKALQYYNKALEWNTRQNHSLGIIDNRIGIALVLANENKKQEGKKSLDEALQIALNVGVDSKILNAYSAYVKFYEILNDYHHLQLSFQKLMSVNDSILSAQQFEMIQELEQNFKIQEDLALSELALKANRNRGIALFSILIVILGFFLWRFQLKRKINRQLQALNQTKDQLFSVISHDLKNPFNSLIGFSELLMEELAQQGDSGKSQKYARYINQSAVEGLKLISNLLHWSLSQSGKIKFNETTVGIQELFDDLQDFFRNETIRNHIQIHFDNQVVRKVLLDTDIVRIVLVNLISNAIKYTPDQGRILILAKRQNEKLVFAVQDSGIGMNENIQKDLFSGLKLHKSQPGLRNETGSGLGLNIVSNLLKIHQGEIHVKSEIGKGSVFEIILPFTPA